MATCGVYTVESSGTLKDFFVQMKKILDAYSGWTAVEDECNDLQLTYTDDMIGGTVTITDSKITEDNYETVGNNSIKLTLTIGEKTYSSSTSAYFSTSNWLGTKETTRKLILSVCAANAFCHVDFLPYNNTSITWSACSVGCTESTRISDGSTVRRFHCASTYVDYDSNFVSLDARHNALSYNVTDGGIIMQKMLLGTSNAYLEVLNNAYACSTVTAGLRYLIGGKHYYALSSNILIPID